MSYHSTQQQTMQPGWLNWLLQHWSFYQHISVSQWDLEDEDFQQ